MGRKFEPGTAGLTRTVSPVTTGDGAGVSTAGTGSSVPTGASVGVAVHNAWGAALGVGGRVRIGGGVGQAVRVNAISGCTVRTSEIAVCSGEVACLPEHAARNAASNSEAATRIGIDHCLPVRDFLITFLSVSSMIRTRSWLVRLLVGRPDPSEKRTAQMPGIIAWAQGFDKSLWWQLAFGPDLLSMLERGIIG